MGSRLENALIGVAASAALTFFLSRMSKKLRTTTAIARGTPTPIPMPAAAPAEIPLFSSVRADDDGVLELVAVAVIPRSDLTAVFNMILPGSMVKFVCRQFSGLRHA